MINRVALYAAFWSSVLFILLPLACDGDDDTFPDTPPTSTIQASVTPAPTARPTESPPTVSCEQWPDAGGTIDNERTRITLPQGDFAALSELGGTVVICYRPSNSLLQLDPTTGLEVSRTVNDPTAGALFDELIAGLETFPDVVPTPTEIGCAQLPQVSRVGKVNVRVTLPEGDFSSIDILAGNLVICHRPTESLLVIGSVTGEEISRRVNDPSVEPLFDQIVGSVEVSPSALPTPR